MPSWLPGVLTASLLFAISHLVFTGRLLERLERIVNDIRKLDDEKLDTALHYAVKDDILKRIDTVAEGVRSAGHRMNGIDQRITSVDDRIKGAA